MSTIRSSAVMAAFASGIAVAGIWFWMDQRTKAANVKLGPLSVSTPASSMISLGTLDNARYSGGELVPHVPSTMIRKMVGLVVPAEQAEVRAGADGQIARVLEGPGQRVHAGQVIVQLSDDELVTRRQRLQARLAGIEQRAVSIDADVLLLQHEGDQLCRLLDSGAANGFEVTRNRLRQESLSALARAMTHEIDDARLSLLEVDRECRLTQCVTTITGTVLDVTRREGETVRRGDLVAVIHSDVRVVLVRVPENANVNCGWYVLAPTGRERAVAIKARGSAFVDGSELLALTLEPQVKLSLGRIEVESESTP